MSTEKTPTSSVMIAVVTKERRETFSSIIQKRKESKVNTFVVTKGVKQTTIKDDSASIIFSEKNLVSSTEKKFMATSAHVCPPGAKLGRVQYYL